MKVKLFFRINLSQHSPNPVICQEYSHSPEGFSHQQTRAWGHPIRLRGEGLEGPELPGQQPTASRGSGQPHETIRTELCKPERTMESPKIQSWRVGNSSFVLKEREELPLSVARSSEDITAVTIRKRLSCRMALRSVTGELQGHCKLGAKVWMCWKCSDVTLNPALCLPSSFRVLSELKEHQCNPSPER